jgi:hypothetical protein
MSIKARCRWYRDGNTYINEFLVGFSSKTEQVKGLSQLKNLLGFKMFERTDESEDILFSCREEFAGMRLYVARFDANKVVGMKLGQIELVGDQFRFGV